MKQWQKTSHFFHKLLFLSQQFHRKYNDRCTTKERSGRCMIYRTDKKIIFVTVYYVHSSHPIKFLPLNCDNGEFKNTLTDIIQASLHGKYVEVNNSELIKAMKQRSWRQLYKCSTSVLVTHKNSKLTILPTQTAADKIHEWNYDKELSFDLDMASWKDIINSIRKLLESDETDQ